jgi:predicted ATP-grasp superfamily ATP-dependent carboligase
LEGERSKHGVRHAADHHQLAEALATLPASAYPLILQQRIVGPGTGIFLLVWDGKVRATFAHRRLREKPPAGGVSVYRESIAADPTLVESSRRLLARLGWQGVAMVEYKIDAATGTPYLMEINGRFWGSLQLAIDAGVDFPRLLMEVSAGGGPLSPPDWTVGVRSRWWWGDVDHVLAMFRGSATALSLPPDHPGRWKTLGDFLVPRAVNRNETLQFDDPRPFIVETLEWLSGR